MRDPLASDAPGSKERRSDLLLGLGITLGPLAAAANTIVGFTVAHWTADTNNRSWSYLVSAIDLALCVCAFAIAFALSRNYQGAADVIPLDGRRSFMAKLAMLLSVFSTLVIIAGTLAVTIVHSTD